MGTERQEVEANRGEDSFCLSALLCLEQRCREPEVFCVAPGHSLEAFGTQRAAFFRNSRSFESRASQFCPIKRRFCRVMVNLACLYYYFFCTT